MIILNTDKLIKIVYQKKTKSSRYSVDENNKIYILGVITNQKHYLEESDISHFAYLEDGVIYYLPFLTFYMSDKTSETKYFKTEELAEQFIEKIKQEPDLKTFTID